MNTPEPGRDAASFEVLGILAGGDRLTSGLVAASGRTTRAVRNVLHVLGRQRKVAQSGTMWRITVLGLVLLASYRRGAS